MIDVSCTILLVFVFLKHKYPFIPFFSFLFLFKDPLRPAGRFQNISSLTILFVDNYNGGEEEDDDDEISTVVTFVGLKGSGSRQKRMAVETVYESRGMKKDHKVKGEFGNQQFL